MKSDAAAVSVRFGISVTSGIGVRAGIAVGAAIAVLGCSQGATSLSGHPSSDAGVADAGMSDAGMSDANSGEPIDAGTPDASTGGTPDSGTDTTPEPLPVDCDAPGRTVAQRLNRAEYENTVRDLLGIVAHPTASFPEDDRANVFDNNAALQSMSSLRLLAHLEAAEALSAQVIEEKPKLVISCWPSLEAEKAPCARQILSKLVSRAYRRPASDEEVDAVVGLYTDSADSGFALALQTAIEGVLVAPQFLFRQIGPGPAEAARPLTDHELATRLSYFLWRTMPDDALRALADAGRLHEEATLEAQTERMLHDARASELVQVMAGQWLALRGLEGTAPDKTRYSIYYDEDLRSSMVGETTRFLGSLLQSNAALGDLVTAPYSFVDAKLAALYGLDPSMGDAYARVDLTATGRRGVLGQASVLALNSNADRTSIVKRGKWILSALLCTPLPDPPANVVQQLTSGDKPVGQREQLAQHRKANECAGCHSLLDPPGLALEGFDLLGRSRTRDDDGLGIDTQGAFADGRSFSGLSDLANIVRDDPRFADCVTSNLMTYALARELNPGDACFAHAIAQAAPARTRTLASVIVALVKSPAMLNQPPEVAQ